MTLVGIAILVKPDAAKAFDPIDTTDLVYIYINHVLISTLTRICLPGNIEIKIGLVRRTSIIIDRARVIMIKKE